MPKQRRGKLAKATPNWRGTCPLCSRGGVKLLWEKTQGESKLMVCKRCGNR